MYTLAKGIMPSAKSHARIKINKTILSTFLEDLGQSILQYFYIEKLAGSANEFEVTLISVNAVFMVVKSVMYVNAVGRF